MTDLPEYPLVTFALFAYNQEQYIREAVEGALTQDYSRLEIILSDDESSDETYSIMERLVASYSGPHKVVLNRNPRNLGIAGHVNHVMTLAQGDLIVAAAGDDISHPNRTRVMLDAWLKGGKRIGSLFSSYDAINSSGKLIDTVKFSPQRWESDSAQRIEGEILVVGATHCWSRALFERYGEIKFDAVNEDAIIQFRASLVDGIDIVGDSLIKYRRHQTNISNLYHGVEPGAGHERAITRIGYERTLKCLRNYQKDLSIEDSIAGGGARIVRLRRLVALKIRLCELRLKFIDGNLRERLTAILRSVRVGPIGLPNAFGMLLQISFPGVYRLVRALAYWRPLGGGRN